MIAILTTRGAYAVDALVASGLVALGAPDAEAWQLPPYACPYGLPVARGADTVLVVSSWLRGLDGGTADPIEVLSGLARRFRVIGLDHSDAFALDFSDAEIRLMERVLKVNGVYTDAKLYNHVVGAQTPDGRWTELLEPRPVPYSSDSLAKLRPSLPCFVGAAPWLRRRTRLLYGHSLPQRVLRGWADSLSERRQAPPPQSRSPRRGVHFRGALTHMQRRDALRRLAAEGVDHVGGLTHIPRAIAGYEGSGLRWLSPAEREALRASLLRERLLSRPKNRLSYLRELRGAKVVLSIVGYGELCFRMAEAWAEGRVLVCQDLSHARVLYPLQAGRNAVFCRPDLSDLAAVLREVTEDFERYREIGAQGYEDWRRYLSELPQHLAQAFEGLTVS